MAVVGRSARRPFRPRLNEEPKAPARTAGGGEPFGLAQASPSRSPGTSNEVENAANKAERDGPPDQCSRGSARPRRQLYRRIRAASRAASRTSAALIDGAAASGAVVESVTSVWPRPNRTRSITTRTVPPAPFTSMSA